jgi:hypothetical protein
MFPERIICLSGESADICDRLGAADRVVAVSAFAPRSMRARFLRLGHPKATSISFQSCIHSTLGKSLHPNGKSMQEQVKDIGLKASFNRLIPLVEFAISTPLNRGVDKLTTGTINPGVIWSGQYFQLGIEAKIPINGETGHNVGVIAQVHFYLDDLFPKIFGKPLFGR